jgi:hypothetical protein
LRIWKAQKVFNPTIWERQFNIEVWIGKVGEPENQKILLILNSQNRSIF